MSMRDARETENNFINSAIQRIQKCNKIVKDTNTYTKDCLFKLEGGILSFVNVGL